MWAQVDGGPAGLQWTFSIRTRGDVVVQFQYMTEPFDTVEAREELRRRINDAVPGVTIPPDRLNGRPSIALQHLIDDATRTALLATFSGLVERTRTAERPDGHSPP